jgi:phytoene dehydrogenase-like protein
MTTDVIVIGGGLNGLTTAVSLAQSSQTVTLFEQQAHLGGAAQTGPGDVGRLDMALVAQLDLSFIEPPALVTAVQPDGPPLTLWRDEARTVADLRQFNQQDADRYADFCREVIALGAQWQQWLAQPAPSLETADSLTFLAWMQTMAGQADSAQRLKLWHTAALSLRHYLRRWFESDLLHGALAAGPLVGVCYGPWADHTTHHLLNQTGSDAVRAVRLVKGGVGALAQALAERATGLGVLVETGTAVSRILLENGQAVGVGLSDGRSVRASQIISSADLRHTLFNLVGAANLAPRTVRHLRSRIYRGSTSQLNLRLRGLPRFNGVVDTDALTGHIVVAPSLAYLENAADAGKYGRIAPDLVLDMMLPTLSDTTLAPPDEHILYITIQHTPYHLRDLTGSVQAVLANLSGLHRDALAQQVIEQLGRYIPDLPSQIIEWQLTTPLGYEQQFGLSEGHIHQGQMELAQMGPLRPLPGCGHYQSPIANLYLCGAGTHPGGGLTGWPGYLAAQKLIA